MCSAVRRQTMALRTKKEFKSKSDSFDFEFRRHGYTSDSEQMTMYPPGTERNSIIKLSLSRPIRGPGNRNLLSFFHHSIVSFQSFFPPPPRTPPHPTHFMATLFFLAYRNQWKKGELAGIFSSFMNFKKRQRLGW